MQIAGSLVSLQACHDHTDSHYSVLAELIINCYKLVKLLDLNHGTESTCQFSAIILAIMVCCVSGSCVLFVSHH